MASGEMKRIAAIVSLTLLASFGTGCGWDWQRFEPVVVADASDAGDAASDALADSTHPDASDALDAHGPGTARSTPSCGSG